MKNKLLLLTILVLALVVRWYKIDDPLADWHSWRQADTASVTREFIKQGMNPLVPRFQDLSSFPSEIFNDQGYRMVEFPLYNIPHALLAQNFTFWSIAKWGRVLSISFSLASIVFLYLIANRLSGRRVAILTAIYMAILPFNVFYSRTVLPDNLMILLVLMGTHFFLKFLDRPSPSLFLLSSLSLSASLLVKPYAAFFLLPLFVFALRRFGPRLLLRIETYLFVAITIAPFILWRDWITNFPAGIPKSGWLYNLRLIRLRPAWWRWLFAERFGKLIMGYWGIIPFFLGLVLKTKLKEHWFYHFWIIGILAYFVIFAGGNVTHDYYQFITIPAIAIFLAKGTDFLLRPTKNFSWPITPLLAAIVIAFALAFSWYEVKGYYQVNNWSIVLAGEKADEIIPPGAKVIAPYSGDTAFLYQTNRTGWPIVQTSIPDLINRGATHYVSVDYNDLTNQVISNPDYQVLEKNDRFVIVKLK